MNFYLGEKKELLKNQKIELQNVKCQGRSHVLARLPSLHKNQINQMEEKHKKEIDDVHRRILHLIDEKVCYYCCKFSL